MKKILPFLFAVVLLALSCSKDDDDFNANAQRSIDSQIIQQYLVDNNLNADSTSSGLHYIITNSGSGNANPVPTSDVQVKYKGYFTNGDVFDQTPSGQSITFPLNGVIAGWTEGIQLLTKGGECMLLIPSYLAYGPAGRGTIPPNTVLLFDIELIDF